MALPGGAGAIEFYVDSRAGNDANDCRSWQTACKDACKLFREKSQDWRGDLVHVNEGSYWFGDGCGLRPSTRIQGHGRVLVSHAAVGQNNRIEGLTFLNGAWARMDGSGAQIVNCRFIGPDSGPVYLGIQVNGTSALIEGNLFKNVNPGIQTNSIDRQWSTFRNNTFVKVPLAILDQNTYHRPAHILNNIFAEVGTAVQYAHAGTLIDFNDFFNVGTKLNGPAPTQPGTHNLEVDPGFLAPERGLYHLAAQSILLDAGSVDNNDPNQGQINRIGAYGAGIAWAGPDWNGWVDDAGASVASSQKVLVNARGMIELREGVTEAGLLGPVSDLGGGRRSVVRQFSYEALQDLQYGFAVDADASTVEREMHYRSSADSFSQTASEATYPWLKATRDQLVNDNRRVRFVQPKLVLRSNAQ